MVRILRLVLGLVLVLLIVDFAVVNRSTVDVSLAPLPLEYPLPIYMVFLLGLVIGALIGGLMLWLGTLTRGAEARRMRNRVWALENQLNILKEQEAKREEAETRSASRPAPTAGGTGALALPKASASA